MAASSGWAAMGLECTGLDDAGYSGCHLVQPNCELQSDTIRSLLIERMRGKDGCTANFPEASSFRLGAAFFPDL
jgi:hypothetical protein